MEKYGNEFERIEAHEKAAYMLINFRENLSRIELSPDLAERGRQLEQIFQEFDALALSLFPVELGHFTAKDQKTISSKYKNAAFEQKRTLRSMLSVLVLAPDSIENIFVDDSSPFYQMFTYAQEMNPSKNKHKLSIESFNQMRYEMFLACPDKNDILTLETVLALHDTSKLKSVAEKIESLSGITSINHDLLLSHMTQNPRLINELTPSLNRLSQSERNLAIQIMNLKYNRGQHAQAEASAAHLVFVSPDYADQKLILLQRQESNADLSGVNGTLGGIYFEEMFKHYLIADVSIDAMRSGALSIKEAYLNTLLMRAEMMGVNITLTENDFMNQAGLEKITLLRFACQYQMSTYEEFDLLNKGFIGLSPESRRCLVETFGRSGLDGKIGILFYYSPALLCEIRDMEIKEDSVNGARFGIERGLRLMSRIAKEAIAYFEKPEMEELPLYRQAKSGELVMFNDVIENRGANQNKNGLIVEYVIALTKIVKDNSRKLMIDIAGEGEADFSWID